MPFRIIREDITRVTADAIVNTANPEAVYGRGTDSGIYKAAGREKLLEVRRKIGTIEPGEVVVTPAFDLAAKYIIHTVGPVWEGGSEGECGILSSCYRKSLLLANNLGCKSIAFPLIAAGNNRFPKEEALDIALNTIAEFLKISEMEVILAVFDRTSFDLSKELINDVEQYIEDNYVDEVFAEEYAGSAQRNIFQTGEMAPLIDLADEGVEDTSSLTEEEFDAYFDGLYEKCAPASSGGFFERRSEAPVLQSPQSSDYAINYSASLDDVIKGLGMSFQEKLLSLIDEKGYSDTQVYKKANLDRRLFSKIRCDRNYKPSKYTALALAISLGLNLDETTDLLRRAGLALSPSNTFDLIVKYCIVREIYDIYDVNALLFRYDQPLLG